MTKKKKQAVAATTVKQDTFFDGIANKFDKNIYGTSKGKIRHQLLLHFLSDFIHSEKELSVLDAGGGTGMMTLPFCQQGHRVTLCDGSEEVLDIAKQRLAEYNKCTIIHSEIEALEPASYDLVLCHAVLEWVNEPKRLLHHLCSLLKPGGTLSLSFFNRDAALFNNAIWGNFDYINKGLNIRNQVRLNPHNAQRPQEIINFLQEHYRDYIIRHKAGIRCFHDYLHDRNKQIDEYDVLFELELKHSSEEPFMWLGKYFHLMLERPESI
ncbi:MAG: methyltransferase domain-containing protein [Glaciecola sp.]